MNLRDTANLVRGQMLRGELTYDDAVATLAPLVVEADKRGAELAKKHGMRYKKISVAALLR